jgi:5'-nucleotidase
MNRGGMRADLTTDRGYVTYSDLFAVHPFGNGLVTVSMTGQQIDALLEQQEWAQDDGVLQVSSGFTYEWDARAPVGQRVDLAKIRLNGTALDPAQSYRVTVNEFLAAGGDGFSVLLRASEPTRGVVDVEALEKYVVENSPVSAPRGGRIVRRN